MYIYTYISHVSSSWQATPAQWNRIRKVLVELHQVSNVVLEPMTETTLALRDARDQPVSPTLAICDKPKPSEAPRFCLQMAIELPPWSTCELTTPPKDGYNLQTHVACENAVIATKV